MEKGHHNMDAPSIMRRKRKVARQQREKTPEPSKFSTTPPKMSDEDNYSGGAGGGSGGRGSTRSDGDIDLGGTTIKVTNDENHGAQIIKMQIRPPGSMSAHKSKILMRRNKAFSGAAIRSSSAPRERGGELDQMMMMNADTKKINSENDGVDDGHDAAEVMHMLRYARRSLSSPRHKEESSESGKSTSSYYQIAPPPPPPRVIQQQKPVAEQYQQQQQKQQQSTDDERLTRLERNLQRFEQERRRFEMDKLLFEREKRELHRMRYKHLEREDRKRLVESYRKFFDQANFPSDSDDKQHHYREQKLGESFKESIRRVPPLAKRKTLGKSPDYESSTVSSAMESSDEELMRPSISERRSRSHSRHSNSSNSSRRRIIVNTEESSQQLQAENILVQRKKSLTTAENDQQTLFLSQDVKQKIETEPKKGFFSKLFSVFSRKKEISTKKQDDKKETEKLLVSEIDITEILKKEEEKIEKLLSVAFLRFCWKEFRQEWKKTKLDYPEEIYKINQLWRKCLAHIVILALFCGFGGLTFRFIEGSWENSYKCEIRKVKRDFIDQLWQTSHNLREDDWKTEARNKLRLFEEQLQTAFEAGVASYSEIKVWSFVNSVMFCLTVVTSIGYGHIAPKTTLGRGITIVYAIIGIPMFLILLADFGKCFTRMIKFFWVYVRRLYYTGTCRKVRKQQQVIDVMRGINTMYDYAIRRPSTYIIGSDLESGKDSQEQQQQLQSLQQQQQQQQLEQNRNIETPTTPYPETIEIDDEFNLPISLATTILLLYIFVGALVYATWENWSYFESFYFVFISMSTIGFGDFVPNHPIFMMCSIIYLVFGLALTSMFINVVQIKLSDSFKQASAKIGATIGFGTGTEYDESQHGGVGGGDDFKETNNNNNDDSPLSVNTSKSITSDGKKLDTITENQQLNLINDDNIPQDGKVSPVPPLLPRKSISSVPQPLPPSVEETKKAKKRFFF